MKTAFVTGGAKGIGLAIAEKLKSEGYTVVVGYNSSENAATRLKNLGYYIVKIDVSDEKSVDNAFDFIDAKFGGADVLVNNAGIALKQKLLVDVTVKEFDDLFSVDVKGVFLCTKRALFHMIEKGRGDVINISSIWASRAASCEVAYSAAKAAVEMMTRSLAAELENSDICVQAIAPSLVETDMNSHLSEEDKLSFLAENGMKRALTPSDIAEEVSKALKTRVNGAVTVVE